MLFRFNWARLKANPIVALERAVNLRHCGCIYKMHHTDRFFQILLQPSSRQGLVLPYYEKGCISSLKLLVSFVEIKHKHNFYKNKTLFETQYTKYNTEQIP